MFGTCDLLEVPGGWRECVATEATSLFTLVKGLPLPAFTAAPPTLKLLPSPGGLETGSQAFFLRVAFVS